MTCRNIIIYLCPGYHSPQLTDDFVSAIWGNSPGNLIIFPGDRLPPYSPQAVRHYLDDAIAKRNLCNQLVSVVWIGFSAGVVGGILAARRWQQGSKKTADDSVNRTVAKFIAIDGWGVPLGQDFPVYRLSHDAWTHRSQELMGLTPGISSDRPVASFIADPAVNHLSLWGSPDAVTGYIVERSPSNSRSSTARCTAATCIKAWLGSH